MFGIQQVGCSNTEPVRNLVIQCTVMQTEKLVGHNPTNQLLYRTYTLDKSLQISKILSGKDNAIVEANLSGE